MPLRRRKVGNPFTAAPAAPSSVSISNIQDLQFQVNWTDNSPNGTTSEEFFEIQVSTTAGFTVIAASTTAAQNATNAVVTGLAAGTAYFARVRAVNRRGASAYAATGASSTTTNTAPADPTSLSYTAVTSSGFTVNWVDNANNELNYQVQVATDAGFTAVVQTQNIAANSLSYIVTGLTSNTTYYARVRALGTSLNSAYLTGGAQATLGVAPNAPSAVNYTNITANEVRIRWTDNATNETGFEIQVASDFNFITIVQNQTGSADSVFIDISGLSSSTTYWARVRAVNSFGNSSYAGGLSFTTNSGLVAPDAPASVGFTLVDETTFTVTYTDTATNEESYQIQIATNADFSTIFQNLTNGADTTSKNVTGLNPYTSYWARVRAVNGAGNSAYTSSAEQKTLLNPSYYGTNLTFWFDGSDVSQITKDGTDRVSAWNNKGTGTPADAVQVSAALQPLYVTTGGGGVSFTGTRILTIAQDLTAVGQRMVFIVFTPTTATSVKRPIVFSGTTRLEFSYTATLRRQASFRTTTGALYNNFGTNNELPLNTRKTASHRVAQVTDFVSGSMYLNSVVGTATNTPAPSVLQALNLTTSWLLGAQDAAGTNSFTGIVHEVFMVRFAPNTGEIDATHAYLTRKWSPS
jgi:hypothetical protein